MFEVPPSPPTRPGSSRTWAVVPLRDAGSGASARSLAGSAGASPSGGRPDDEFHLDAVADDPGQRLADQRAVAGLEPVLREAVRDGDLEPLVVHVDELGVAHPGLVVGR